MRSGGVENTLFLCFHEWSFDHSTDRNPLAIPFTSRLCSFNFTNTGPERTSIRYPRAHLSLAWVLRLNKAPTTLMSSSTPYSNDADNKNPALLHIIGCNQRQCFFQCHSARREGIKLSRSSPNPRFLTWQKGYLQFETPLFMPPLLRDPYLYHRITFSFAQSHITFCKVVNATSPMEIVHDSDLMRPTTHAWRFGYVVRSPMPKNHHASIITECTIFLERLCRGGLQSSE